jgi:WhiB family redox-sensing transcriptional regulator
MPTPAERLPCDGLTELFYPDEGGNYILARWICDACPYSGPCLEVALRRREPHGMWGGKSPNERRRLIRLSRAA